MSLVHLIADETFCGDDPKGRESEHGPFFPTRYNVVEKFSFKMGFTAHGSLGGHSGEPVAFKGFV